MASNARGHALTILRTLDEHGEGDFSELICRDLLLLTGLNEALFNKADLYLLGHHLVEGTQGGLDGSRWMTATGIDYLHNAMATRMALSLEAERLLRYMADRPETTNWSHQTLMTALNFDKERYRAACRYLHSFDLLRIFVNQGGWEVIGISKEGQRAVYEDFKSPHSPYTNVTFDQRGQQVIYQYNAAGDINIGAVQDKVALIEQLEKLKAEISKAEEAQAIDADTATEARFEIERAVNQAKKEQPDKKTLVERIEAGAKVLQAAATGVTAVPALIDAIHKTAAQIPHLPF